MRFVLEKLAENLLEEIRTLQVESSTYFIAHQKTKFGRYRSLLEVERAIREALRRSTTPLEEANAVEKAKVGNCQHMCYLTFLLISRHKSKVLLEGEILEYNTKGFYENEAPDHAVVLFGRRAGSQIADFTSWGDDWVLVDPWLDKFFTKETVKDMEVPFRGYSTTVSWYEMKAFEPSRHKFKSVLTLEEFQQNRHICRNRSQAPLCRAGVVPITHSRAIEQEKDTDNGPVSQKIQNIRKARGGFTI